MKSMRLGKVQLQIMQLLWEKQTATAREITDAINATEPVAHSTVQTMLRVLEDKGSVGHRQEGRTFVFFPKVKEHDLKQLATQNLVERLFGGRVSNLVAHLLSVENVSREELAEIRKLVQRQTKR
ncbi:MAG TPA: BlaI/MecI/CopY family transcriptional regulator [Planctomycetaceae bacterium]|jgi:BlaI family penicillinase repressor